MYIYICIYIHRLQVAHTESFHLFNLSAIHLILSKYCLLITACLRFVEIQKSLGPGCNSLSALDLLGLRCHGKK